MAKPAKIESNRECCVAGYVKVHPNKDKSITFTVAGKRGKKFTLSSKSDHAKRLSSAKRVLVKYQESDRNPKVLFVIENPSSKLIREHNADSQ